MPETLPLTQAECVRLLDERGCPNPDDAGPYGSTGPIIRRAFGDLSWVLLGPPDLPPYFEIHPDPWCLAALPVP